MVVQREENQQPYSEMARMRRNVQDFIEREEGDHRFSLFSNKNINVLLLDNFKVPTISAYEGLIDPKEHLDVLNENMDLARVSHLARCHYFVVNLIKNVKKWFKKFLHGFITSLQ